MAYQLVGGHLALAQVVAWARMVQDYSREHGLVQGVENTFDGEHPCEMCLRIAKAREAEDKQGAEPIKRDKSGILKMMGPAALYEHADFTPYRNNARPQFEDPSARVDEMARAPETPPPRAEI